MKKNNLTSKVVSFENNASIKFQDNNLPKNFILKVLVIFFGVFGTIYCLTSCFVNEVMDITILFDLIIFISMNLLLYSKFKFKWVILILFALFYGMIFWSQFNSIVFGFWDIMEEIEQMLYVYNRESIRINFQNVSNTLSVVTLILTTVFSFCVIKRGGAFLVYLVSAPFLIVPLVGGYEPSILAFAMLLVSWVCIFVLDVSNIMIKKKHQEYEFIKASKANKYTYINEKVKNGLSNQLMRTMCILTLSVYIMVNLIVATGINIRPDSLDVLGERIYNYAVNFSFSEFVDQIKNIGNENINTGDNALADGGISSGKLGEYNKVEYKNTPVMEVFIDQERLQNTVYFKSFTWTQYNGNSWTGIPKEYQEENKEKFNAISNYDSNPHKLLSLLSYYKIALNNGDIDKSNNKVIAFGELLNTNISYIQLNLIPYNLNHNFNFYTSYFTDSYSFDLLNSDDGTTLNNPYNSKYNPDVDGDYVLYNYNIEDNILDFIDLFDNNKQNIKDLYYKSVMESEKQYSAFVSDLYTQLPNSNFKNQITQQFSYLNNGSYSLSDKLSEVKMYLAENCTYTLSPGKLPEGKDFVQYFLTESKKGYCTYFASAATYIYRTLGIPARYVEGYAVSPKEFKFDSLSSTSVATVKDKDAHAWVEIYLDEFGWVPIEVTPPASGNNNGTTTTSKPNVTTSKVSTSSTSKITTNSQSTSKITTTVKDETNVNKQKIINLLLIIIIIVVFSYFWYIIFKRKLINNKRIKSFSTDNYSNNVINLFNYLEEVLHFTGISNEDNLAPMEYSTYLENKIPYFSEYHFKQIMVISLKAGHSTHEISEQEYKQVKNFCEGFVDSVYQQLPTNKKILFKYIACLY